MSILGILSSNLFASGASHIAQNAQSAQGSPSNFRQLATEFQQLSQDLQSGNLTQAQQDYTTISQNLPGRARPARIRRTPTPRCRRSRSSARICKPGSCNPRSRTTPRSSRTRSKASRRRRAIAGITITARKARSPRRPSNPIPSCEPSAPWRRICRLETCPGLRARSPLCRTTCSRSAGSCRRCRRARPHLRRRRPAPPV